MKTFWQRFLATLTPGVKVLLSLLAAVYLVAVVGSFSHTFALSDWLPLTGSQFWHGQVWRLMTYALLPLGILDFLMNSIALIVLGSMLERHWSRGEFWRYCLVATAGAGVIKVLLDGSSQMPLTGITPMLFGLLIAWGFLCGHEVINLMVFGEVTVWKLVLVSAGISCLIIFLTGGLFAAIIMAGGGLTGFIYLWFKHKWLMSQRSRVIHSERINRLEL